MIRLLQRYLYGELLRVFVLAVSVMTVVMVVVGLVQQVSQHGLGLVQMLRIMPFLAPSLLPFTIPATFLLTVSLVYGRLAAGNEITAAKAAGIHLLSVLKPAFVMAVVLSVFSYVLTDRVIPWSVHNIQRVVTSAMEEIFLDVLRSENHITLKGHNTTITVVGVRGQTLLRPSFRYAPSGRAIRVQADEAELHFDLENQQLVLHLVNGHVDVPGQGRVFFAEETYPFPLPDMIRKSRVRHLRSPDIEQRLAELRREQEQIENKRAIAAAFVFGTGRLEELIDGEWDLFRSAARDTRAMIARLRTEYHSRIALSCSCLFLALVGAPYAVQHAHDEFLLNFFRCFLPVLLLYYPLTLLMMNLAKSGAITPVGTLWVGNGVMLLAGHYILRQALRS